MLYLTTHSTHFIYGYMASDIWLRTILIVRKETRCRHIGYSYRLTARVLLYTPSHRQDNTYHSLCYTSRGALAGARNSSMGPPHEGSIRRPTVPWANALPLSYVPLVAAKEPLYALSHKQDNTYHRLCYTSCETRNSLMGPPGGTDPTHYHHALSCSHPKRRILKALQKNNVCLDQTQILGPLD